MSAAEGSPDRRADIEVSSEADKVALKVPGGAATLTAGEAQELSGRIFEAATRAGGEDPVENGWVRIPMQYLRFAAEKMDLAADDADENRVPAPNSDEPDGDTGEVHCWIKDQTEANARHIASGTIAEHGWLPTELIDHQPVTRADFDDEDAREYLPYYEQAIAESEVFLYEIDDGSEGSDNGGS